MEECNGRLEKMVKVLVDDSDELTDEEHNLVMHDLYTIFADDQDKGEKGLVILIEAYEVNLKRYHGYEDNQGAFSHVKERLYKASQNADKIIGKDSTFVERYFIETVAKIETNDICQSLIEKLKSGKGTSFSSKDFGRALYSSELDKNFSGPRNLLHALAFFYKNNDPRKLDSEKALLEAYRDLESYAKEMDGTLDSKDVGSIQYFVLDSILVN